MSDSQFAFRQGGVGGASVDATSVVAPGFQSRTGPTELAAGRNFTQGDVDANRLSYTPRRRGDDGGFQGHDSFRFSLSDLEHQSSAHTFSIAISGAHKGQSHARQVDDRKGRDRSFAVTPTLPLFASSL